jgi:CyaY protein
MSESEFLELTDRVLGAIGTALDDADADVDWALADGVLTIEADDGSKLIVNRQAANREVWIAARSGGYHYRVQNGAWRDTRSGDEMGAALSRLLETQAGVEDVAFVLPAA